MSILITGGTGFIGAEVARQLLAQGETEISILHRSGNFQRLHDVAGRLDCIQADLGDHDRIMDVVQTTRPQVIYHLGAMLTGQAEQEPQAAVQANGMGSYCILEAARLFDVPQVLFASSIGSYGADIREKVISDYSLQRPFTMYGITKLFTEHLGRFYKRKYQLDFRGLRSPSIIGPGVKTPSAVQFTSWVIEECSRGNPFTIRATPETAVPVMYYKDAARAIIQLGQAPLESIKMVNYLVNGMKPTPTARQLAGIVRQKFPGAQIDFQPDPAMQPLLDAILRPLDDGLARAEWGWQPQYDQAAIVDDFLQELKEHPERYQ
jgi:threonine 3-dehydrogenase